MATKVKRTTEATHLVSSDAQWAVFASPVRLEIIEFMETLGACSIAELARHMARPADTLYHHIRKLVDVGIVKQNGWQKVGRQSEAVYELIAPTILFDYDPKTKRGAHHFQRLASAILRNADRRFKAATDSNEPVFKGVGKNLWVRQETVRLGDQALRKINARLLEIQRILQSERSNTDGRLHTYTVVLVPNIEKGTNRRRSAPSIARQEQLKGRKEKGR